MKPSKYLELRDITSGDFAIKHGELYYAGMLYSTKAEIIFETSEEVFFRFVPDQENEKCPFDGVIFLNFAWLKFFKYKGNIYFDNRYLSFEDSDGRQHSYTMVSHDGGSITKAIGSNFVNGR